MLSSRCTVLLYTTTSTTHHAQRPRWFFFPKRCFPAPCMLSSPWTIRSISCPTTSTAPTARADSSSSVLRVVCGLHSLPLFHTKWHIERADSLIYVERYQVPCVQVIMRSQTFLFFSSRLLSSPYSYVLLELPPFRNSYPPLGHIVAATFPPTLLRCAPSCFIARRLQNFSFFPRRLASNRAYTRC